MTDGQSEVQADGGNDWRGRQTCRQTRTIIVERRNGASPALNCLLAKLLGLSLVSGHYLYSQAVDSSIASSSVLTTAVYNASTFSCSLSFAYNLQGTGIGLLVMYIDTQTAHLANWKKTSNTKPEWSATQVHVGHMTSQFQVIFNASHDSGTDGVMALDDITFHACESGKGDSRSIQALFVVRTFHLHYWIRKNNLPISDCGLSTLQTSIL